MKPPGDAYTLDGVPKPIVAVIVAVVLALFGGVAFAVRRARTEHPPVSATIPRVEELGRTPAEVPAPRPR